MKRILLSILVVGILLLSACGAPSEIPSPTPTTQTEPQLIKEWTGIGDAVTPTFEVTGEDDKPIEFEVRWTAEAATGENVFFSWTVHFGSASTSPLEGNPYGVLEGSIPVQFYHPNPFATKGEFVIEVIASSNCKWTIEVWTSQ